LRTFRIIVQGGATGERGHQLQGHLLVAADGDVGGRAFAGPVASPALGHVAGVRPAGRCPSAARVARVSGTSR